MRDQVFLNARSVEFQLPFLEFLISISLYFCQYSLFFNSFQDWRHCFIEDKN